MNNGINQINQRSFICKSCPFIRSSKEHWIRPRCLLKLHSISTSGINYERHTRYMSSATYFSLYCAGVTVTAARSSSNNRVTAIGGDCPGTYDVKVGLT
jgi:hypothetical protein